MTRAKKLPDPEERLIRRERVEKLYDIKECKGEGLYSHIVRMSTHSNMEMSSDIDEENKASDIDEGNKVNMGSTPKTVIKHSNKENSSDTDGVNKAIVSVKTGSNLPTVNKQSNEEMSSDIDEENKVDMGSTSKNVIKHSNKENSSDTDEINKAIVSLKMGRNLPTVNKQSN